MIKLTRKLLGTGRDERIKADRFVEGEEFAYRLMKAFSAAGAP